MSRLNKVWVWIGVVVIVIVWMRIGYRQTNLITKPSFVGGGIHTTAQFVDADTLQSSLRFAEHSAHSLSTVYGAVVPHHQVAGFIMADVLKQAITPETETVIILAPNHKNIGSTPVLSSRWRWRTPWGDIVPNTEIIDNLTRKEYISIDEDIIGDEHAIGGLLPYIAYLNKQVRIVPLIIKPSLSQAELQDLSVGLLSQIDKKTVVVASVDFSHYLQRAEAEKKDQETLQAIKAKKYNELLRMRSDHLDSGEAVVVLLRIMDQLKAYPQVLYTDNSGRILGKPGEASTGYLGIVFTKI